MATAVELSKPGTRAKGPRPPIKRVVLLVKVGMRRRGVLHLRRAAARFGERLGSQFAGAITYFSFLALVPILMVSFSVAGFVLSAHQDLLQQLQHQVAEQIPGKGLASTITDALDAAIKARYSVGIVGLVIALYSGIGWMGNIRAAVQAQWRPDFDNNQEMAADSVLANLFRNLWMLVGLGLALLVSLVLSSVGNSLATEVLTLFGLEHVSWLKPVVVAVSLVLAIAADLLIFLWVYSVLPPENLKVPRTALIRGSIIAAVGFEILKFALTNILPGALSGGSTGKVFGPIIGLLAFFNLVATLVLFVAAWISTSDGGPVKQDNPVVLAGVPVPAVVVHNGISKPKIAGLLSVGALLGWSFSRTRSAICVERILKAGKPGRNRR